MRFLALVAAATLSLAGAAVAQAPAPPAGHMATMAKSASSSMTTTASKSTALTGDKATLSKACSDQANAKSLHGKARKTFRNACKHGKA